MMKRRNQIFFIAFIAVTGIFFHRSEIGALPLPLALNDTPPVKFKISGNQERTLTSQLEAAVIIEKEQTSALFLANQYIIKNPSLFPIRSYHELEASSRQSPLGTLISYHVNQDGYPIVGMQIDLMVGKSGKIKVLSNQYRSIARAKIEPKEWLPLGEVLQGYKGIFKPVEDDRKEMMIWSSSGSNNAELVYIVSVQDMKKKQIVSGQAIFGVTSGHLLARHFPRAEFN